jgi:tetratricopeptide (TPR) repeat protein
MCADCHSTNLAKNYDPATDSYRTTWSELHVGCEACHGPGSKHLAWAASPSLGADPGLLVRLRESEPGAWGLDPETGHPKRTRPLDSQVQLETCAPCHSHRQLLQPRRWMGQPYLDTHVNSALDRVHYHADGQIKEEVYVYGSFIQSRMFQNDVRCIDCHHPHTMRLHAEGNALCVRCHQPARYDTPAHHFHPTGGPGASCVECHMPPKHYMVVDKRRDHSLRVPRPDLSRKFGTPNACNTCHTDRDTAWAADAFTAWWGDKPRPSYGETLAKGRRDVAVWERELLQLARDPAAPGIARASALQLLDEAPSARSLEAARERLREDPDPLARRHAVSLLENLPPAERWDAARIGLRDSLRAVRTETARILAATPRDNLSSDDRAALESGIAEYRDMQLAVADVPESHLALADLHVALGEPARAEEEWAAALRIDPGFTAARVNWAEFLFARDRLAEAEPILREGVERRPDDGYVHEAWGRYLVRRQRYEEGIAAVRRAAELQPDRADLHYFIGVGFHTVGRFEDALPSLRKAVELAPGNEEYRSGAAAICRDAGREDLMVEFLPPRAP